MTIHRLMYWLFVAVGMVLFATIGFLLTEPFLRLVSQRWGEDVTLSPLWTRIGFTTAGIAVGHLGGQSRL
jgi:hypothetical protein